MGNTKKSLLASGLAVLASAALLMGSTFAWFTDSVANTGNVIQSGDLEIQVTAYRLENGKWGDAILDYGDNWNPLIDAADWEPGQYGAVLLKVRNQGSLAAKVDLDFRITDSANNLEDALWFNLQSFTSAYGSASAGAAEDLLLFEDAATRPSDSTDATCMNEIEAATLPTVTQPQGSDSWYAYYVLEYGMYTSAGNEYQNGTFGLDFTVLATQAPVEEDGFGDSTYDEDAEFATYNVATEDEFKTALADAKDGDVIALSSNITVDEPIVVDKAVTINGNGADFITSVENNFALEIPNGVGGVTIKNCDIAGSDSASTTSARPMGIVVRPGAGDVTIEGCTFTGAAAQLGHAVWIDGGNTGSVTITGCETSRPINLSGYNATVSNVTIEGNTFTNTFGVTEVTLSGALENVSIRNNSFGWGGIARIHADGLNNFSFTNVVIADNTGANVNITVDAAVQELYDAALANGGIVVENNVQSF